MAFAAFALYAVVSAQLGPAGGAAVVVGVFAGVAAAAAFVAVRKILPRARRGASATPAEKLTAFAKERPVLALGVAALVTTLVVRNPATVSAIVSAFVAGGGGRKSR